MSAMAPPNSGAPRSVGRGCSRSGRARPSRLTGSPPPYSLICMPRSEALPDLRLGRRPATPRRLSAGLARQPCCPPAGRPHRAPPRRLCGRRTTTGGLRTTARSDSVRCTRASSVAGTAGRPVRSRGAVACPGGGKAARGRGHTGRSCPAGISPPTAYPQATDCLEQLLDLRADDFPRTAPGRPGAPGCRSAYDEGGGPRLPGAAVSVNPASAVCRTEVGERTESARAPPARWSASTNACSRSKPRESRNHWSAWPGAAGT